MLFLADTDTPYCPVSKWEKHETLFFNGKMLETIFSHIMYAGHI